MPGAALTPGAGNPFLDPILARDRSGLFARFEGDDGWISIDLATLLASAARFAGLYAMAGLGPRDRVLVILHPGLDPHAAFFGAMLIGAIPSFMPYPNAKQQHEIYWGQHRAIFQAVRPAAILTFGAIRAEIETACDGLAVRVLMAEAAETVAPIVHWRLPPSDAIAFIQYSSGTTGLKKGVPVSYTALAAHIHAYRGALRLDQTAHPVVATWLPLYHDMGLITGFLMPLLLGAPIISVDPFEWTMRPDAFLAAVGTFRATHMWMPNFALLHHVNRAGATGHLDLGSVRAIICCSEPCKPDTFDAFGDRFAASGLRREVLQTCYAMAETVFAISQSVIGTPPRQVRGALSNGPPVTGCSVRIAEDGEIWVRAPWLFAGYQDAPAGFRDGYFPTGDLGFIDGDEIFVIGRIKDVIIVNGRNIFAHDVEAAISAHAAVRPGRVVAFGRFSDRQGSEQLIVVAEAESGAAAEINRAVLAALGVACHDIRLVPLGWLIKTTSGKMSRSDNAQKYAEFFQSE